MTAANAKFFLGYVGPCRDGVPARVVAIVPEAHESQQLVYLRDGDGSIHLARLNGMAFNAGTSGLDLLPPAPKMVTRWIAVNDGAGWDSEAKAREYTRGWNSGYTIVPIEVEVK